MEEKLIRQYITISSGMRGYYAVLVGVFKYPGNDEESHEPIVTGIGSYPTIIQAIPEGISWANAEGIPFIWGRRKE